MNKCSCGAEQWTCNKSGAVLCENEPYCDCTDDEYGIWLDAQAEEEMERLERNR